MKAMANRTAVPTPGARGHSYAKLCVSEFIYYARFVLLGIIRLKQLQDAYQEALQSGLSEQEARAAAQLHINDWQELNRSLTQTGCSPCRNPSLPPIGSSKSANLPRTGKFCDRDERIRRPRNQHAENVRLHFTCIGIFY